MHLARPTALAIRLAFHQGSPNQLGGNLLGGAAEEGLGEVLGGVVAMRVTWAGRY